MSNETAKAVEWARGEFIRERARMGRELDGRVLGRLLDAFEAAVRADEREKGEV